MCKDPAESVNSDEAVIAERRESQPRRGFRLQSTIGQDGGHGGPHRGRDGMACVRGSYRYRLISESHIIYNIGYKIARRLISEYPTGRHDSIYSYMYRIIIPYVYVVI